MLCSRVGSWRASVQCLGGFNYRRPPPLCQGSLDRKRSEGELEKEGLEGARECGWLFESFRDKGDRTHGQIADFKGGARFEDL